MKTLRSKKAVLFGAALVSALLVAAWSGPLLAADADAGGAIYKKTCAVCHGAAGAGDGPMGKLLKPPPPDFSDASRMAGQSDEELTKIITEGKDRMPSYGSRLSAAEIENVVAFIRSLAH